MLLRDWRAGELSVLLFALVLAVASVGTVGFFADRVKGALTRQANLLLGADVLVSGDRPLPPAFAAEAARRGLASTPALSSTAWSTRAAAGAGAPVLADVKAVAPGLSAARRHPARRSGQPRRNRRADGIPAPGEAWPDTRLARGWACSAAIRSPSARRRSG